NRQEPYVYGSYGGNDLPLVPAQSVAPSVPADIRQDYELALQVGNKDALNAFLAQYPDGYYANLARLQLAKIAAREMRAAVPEKPSTDQERPSDAQKQATSEAAMPEDNGPASQMAAAE